MSLPLVQYVNSTMQKSITKAVSVDDLLVNVSGLQDGNDTAVSIGEAVISSDKMVKMDCPVNQSINGFDVDHSSQFIQDFNVSCWPDPQPFELVKSGIDLSNNPVEYILMNETLLTRPVRDEDP